MKRRYIILQLLGLCSVLPVFMATVSAQNNIVVRAQMDSAAIMMGDQTTVRLEVSQDKDKFVKRLHSKGLLFHFLQQMPPSHHMNFQLLIS